jgi:hypothetical protein
VLGDVFGEELTARADAVEGAIGNANIAAVAEIACRTDDADGTSHWEKGERDVDRFHP